MSQGSKSILYRKLKATGYLFKKHYRDYSTDELEQIFRTLGVTFPEPPVEEEEAPAGPPKREPEPWGGLTKQLPKATPRADPPAAAPPTPSWPITDEPVHSRPGEQLYDDSFGQAPLRQDLQGNLWFIEEFLKPAIPKERVHRKLTYIDPGVKRSATKEGQFFEEFEVSGEERREAEVRISLPSFQVGLYKDPRFPFRIHVYNGRRCFNKDDLDAFYGGADLVPSDIAKEYVSNILGYDIQTTIRAIQKDYAKLQQTGAIA